MSAQRSSLKHDPAIPAEQTLPSVKPRVHHDDLSKGFTTLTVAVGSMLISSLLVQDYIERPLTP